MRVFNFSAGPATLPLPVLEQARDELLDFNGTGMSVMEMSHRGSVFREVAQRSEACIRRLMSISDDYAVLFLQGGAQLQFSSVPLNLLGNMTRADYVDTGIWSQKAIAEAKRYARVNVVASSEDARYTYIPDESDWERDPDAAYLHYTPNETIGGVEFHFVPQDHGVPLVADMSSTILSRPLDVSRFGLIYAGAQKNIGISGITVVIVRKDLLDRASPMTPLMMTYALQAKENSMGNTVPTFAWYVAGLVFEWLEGEGGVDAIAKRNERKANKLYDCIDKSNFYASPVAANCRSWMNVPFTLADSALDKRFLSEAQEAGLSGLEGHRFVGGMRASIYNAMPEQGVDALVAFMRDFEQRAG